MDTKKTSLNASNEDAKIFEEDAKIFENMKEVSLNFS